MIPSVMFQVGAPASFKYFIRNLQNQGIIYFITDLLMPLLLIFSLLFAILQKVKIFKEGKDEEGEPNTKINATISFLIAVLVVVPHLVGAYDPKKDPILIMKNMLPGGVLILVAILIVMAIIYLTSGKTPGILSFLIALTGIFFLFYIIAAAVFPKMSWGPLKDPGIQVLLISLLIAGLWLYFLMRKPPEKDAIERSKHFWDLMGFGRGK